MGKFKWSGVTKDGKKVQQVEEFSTQTELRKTLKSRGIRPVKISTPTIFEMDINSWMAENGFAKTFSNKELLMFTKQLYLMINAGVPILQSLEILYKQERHSTLKVSIKNIFENVGNGKSLSESMAMERGFDKLYCNLVKAGESGGVLDLILEKLSTYLERQEKTKSDVKSAMAYPFIVIVVGFAVIMLLMIFVVPRFVDMLTESKQQIPAVTQFVINISNFIQNNVLYILVGVIGGAFFIKNWIKTEAGKAMWDIFTMNIPLFGEVVIKGNLSSFTRTLATMLSSGVSLIDALEICGKIIENVHIAGDIAKVKKQVEEGKSLSDPLKKIPYFPIMVAQMVKVGEQTGNLDSMFEKIAVIFESDVEKTIQTATKLMEPLILVVLGGIICLILVAMYLPIFMAAGGTDG